MLEKSRVWQLESFSRKWVDEAINNLYNSDSTDRIIMACKSIIELRKFLRETWIIKKEDVVLNGKTFKREEACKITDDIAKRLYALFKGAKYYNYPFHLWYAMVEMAKTFTIEQNKIFTIEQNKDFPDFINFFFINFPEEIQFEDEYEAEEQLMKNIELVKMLGTPRFSFYD